MTRRSTTKTVKPARVLAFTPEQPRSRSPLDRAGSVARFERTTKAAAMKTLPTLDQALSLRAQAALLALIEEVHRDDK